jgi:hypothetical protein
MGAMFEFARVSIANPRIGGKSAWHGVEVIREALTAPLHSIKGGCQPRSSKPYGHSSLPNLFRQEREDGTKTSGLYCVPRSLFHLLVLDGIG